MAKSNLPKSWEEFYASFVQIPSEHGGPWNFRIKYILKLCALCKIGLNDNKEDTKPNIDLEVEEATNYNQSSDWKVALF